jgi:hypothetical protein
MDVQSYTELKLKFDRMIEKDRVRKRRTRRVAFGAHAVIAATAIPLICRGTAQHISTLGDSEQRKRIRR